MRLNHNKNKNISTNVDKINKSKSLLNDTRNSTTSSSCNQSDLNDVFNNQSDDSEFQEKIIKSKLNSSSTSTNINKNNKSVFTSPNKYRPLTTDDINDTVAYT
jgi:hypothetical protein